MLVSPSPSWVDRRARSRARRKNIFDWSGPVPTPTMQNCFKHVRQDVRAHPVGRVRHEAEVAARIEAPHRLEEADVAFLDEVGEPEAVPAVLHRDRDHVAQVAVNQLVGRRLIMVLGPAPREAELGLAIQPRIATDLMDVRAEARLVKDPCHIDLRIRCAVWTVRFMNQQHRLPFFRDSSNVRVWLGSSSFLQGFSAWPLPPG